MGCGKSKHAVEAATTIVKSTKSDGGKEVQATKTVTENGDASVVQHEVETKSLVIEDTKKESMTTKLEPGGVATVDNVPPTSGENVEKSVEAVKEDEKVKDSNVTYANDVGTDNVAPTTGENVEKVAKDVKDEKVEDSNETNANDTNKDNVVSTSSKDDVSDTEAVTDDKEKKESNVAEAKTENVTSKRVGEIKVSNPTKDNVKNEFMTPTLSEDVVETPRVFKDSKEENIKSTVPDEESLETVDDPSDPIDNSPKTEEENDVEPTTDLTEVETKTEEDVEVTEDVEDTETSPTAISPTVTTTEEPKVVETQEKEP